MTDIAISALEDRFLRYAQIDTQSDAASPATPSTERQFDLLRLLQRELADIGAHDIVLTPYGALLATIPASVERAVPVIALCAHVDTSQQFNGFSVKPLVHRNWRGGDIVLPDDPAQALSGAKFPYLASKVGEDIVTASGTTLLGADDKAGVAIVMTVAQHLLAHPHIPHGAIRLCFTPDEEIGRGVHKDLPRDLAADVAYTLDGAEKGEIVCETFSADQAVVRVNAQSDPKAAEKRMIMRELDTIMGRIALKSIDADATLDRLISIVERVQAVVHPNPRRSFQAQGP